MTRYGPMGSALIPESTKRPTVTSHSAHFTPFHPAFLARYSSFARTVGSRYVRKPISISETIAVSQRAHCGPENRATHSVLFRVLIDVAHRQDAEQARKRRGENTRQNDWVRAAYF
jgi:hypothetical protein